MQRVCAVLVCLILGLTLSARAQSDREQERIGTDVLGDGLIIPGQRIGPVKIGMSISQILQVLPPGYKREVFDTQKVVLYEWRSQGFWVSLDADGKSVRIISVFGSGSYRTDKGVQLLHPESKIIEVYGTDLRRYEYPQEQVTLVRYVPLGLQFGLINQPSNRVLHGRIFQIGIFVPGKEPPLTKKPSQ